MDLVCGACGERNPAGTQFCLFCSGYLWEPATVPAGRAAAPAASPAAASPITPTLPEAEADPGWICPRCDRENQTTRRFCSHCGHAYATPVTVAPVAAEFWWRTWWRRVWDSRDRAARLAYRRSLPAGYRWRRGILALVVAALAVAGLAVSRQNPRQLVMSAYYQLRPTYVSVAGVVASVDPATATVKGSQPELVVDHSLEQWTMAWKTKQDGTCAGAPDTGALVLTFPPTRIRKVLIWGGLAPSNPDRPTESRPRRIGITFPGQTCRPAELPDKGDVATDIPADSGAAVSSVRITVDSVYPGTTDSKRVSLTEVSLKSYPTG